MTVYNSHSFNFPDRDRAMKFVRYLTGRKEAKDIQFKGDYNTVELYAKGMGLSSEIYEAAARLDAKNHNGEPYKAEHDYQIADWPIHISLLKRVEIAEAFKKYAVHESNCLSRKLAVCSQCRGSRNMGPPSYSNCPECKGTGKANRWEPCSCGLNRFNLALSHVIKMDKGSFEDLADFLLQRWNSRGHPSLNEIIDWLGEYHKVDSCELSLL